MIAYAKEIKVCLERWPDIKVRFVDRSVNEAAYALARLGATLCPIEGRWIQVDIMIAPTIENLTLSLIDSDKQDWRLLIKEYIIEGNEPKDALKKKRLETKIHTSLYLEKNYTRKTFLKEIH